MHLGRVVAPRDQHIALVQVGVAAGRFVDAVGCQESRHCRCHAKPSVGIDVVIAKSTFHELLRSKALGDRPLAGTVESKLFRGFA